MFSAVPKAVCFAWTPVCPGVFHTRGLLSAMASSMTSHQPTICIYACTVACYQASIAHFCSTLATAASFLCHLHICAVAEVPPTCSQATLPARGTTLLLLANKFHGISRDNNQDKTFSRPSQSNESVNRVLLAHHMSGMQTLLQFPVSMPFCAICAGDLPTM